VAVRLADDSERRRARSFGDVAEDYDLARPTYPVEAVSWLLGRDPLEVVDLGAGTGRLTEVLVGAGHRVTAVEPLPALREKLSVTVPEARLLVGTAEDIPLPDASADAVLVGQAFHWFDVEPALAEIARVLRPCGRIGLLWNFRESTPGWMRDLTAIAGENDLPEGWVAEFEALERVALVEAQVFRLEHLVDRDRLLALVRSWSYVATRPADERDEILRRVGELWDGHPELAHAGEAAMPYRTEAYRVQLAAGDHRSDALT
jgi:SAM-dependent methyltransferase